MSAPTAIASSPVNTDKVIIDPVTAKPLGVKRQFRLLVGWHVEAQKDLPLTKDGMWQTKRFYQGDIVESYDNLCALHNQPGALKFEEIISQEQLPGETKQEFARRMRQIAELAEKEAAAEQAKAEAQANVSHFDTMSIEDLKKHAQLEEIDIRQCKSRDQLVAACRKHAEAVLKGLK